MGNKTIVTLPINSGYTQVGLNENEIRISDEKSKQMDATAASGGLTPTKRDNGGNILLYEDPENVGSQLEQPDQWISIPVVKPDYDDDQAVGVLDAQISELYKGRDVTEIQRLRNLVEDLRRRLGQATGFSDDEEDDRELPIRQGEHVVGIPTVGETITIEDFSSGLVSNSNLGFSVVIGIWDSELQKIDEIGVGKAQTVLYHIVSYEDYTNDKGETIQADISYGTEALETPYDIRKLGNGQFIGTNEKYDVVLNLLGKNLSNFYGWFYKDMSNSGKWTSIATDKEFRFDLIRRRLTDDPAVDADINNYQLLVAFKDEVPTEPPAEISKLNLSVAFVSTEGNREIPFLFDDIAGEFFRVELTDRATKEIVGREFFSNPVTLEHDSNKISAISVAFNRSELPSTGVEGYVFIGWYEYQSNIWVKLGSSTRLLVPLNFDERTIVAGYAFSDDVSSPVPDKEKYPDEPDSSGTSTKNPPV